jgi:hypothetical protein
MDDEEKRIFEEMFEQMPGDLKAAFESAVAASGKSKEEFVEGLWDEIAHEEPADDEDELLRSIFVGDCPECGSTKTFSGDEVEQIDDPTVGYCEDCGLLWCLECKLGLDAGTECGHWDVCEECSEEKDEFGDCGIMPAECPVVLEWQTKLAADRFTKVCAWCGGDIPEGDDVFGTGAKIREGIDFVQSASPNGFFMEVTIGGRRVPAVVTGKDSDARKAGNDLMFMTCSVECAEELRVALEHERDVIEKAQLN